eukprot:896388_1
MMTSSSKQYKKSPKQLLKFGNSIIEKSDQLSSDLVLVLSNVDGAEMVRTGVSKSEVLLLRDLVRQRIIVGMHDLPVDPLNVIMSFMTFQELAKLNHVSKHVNISVGNATRVLRAISVTGRHPRECGVIMILARRGVLSKLRSFTLDPSLAFNPIWRSSGRDILRTVAQHCPRIEFILPEISTSIILSLQSPLKMLKSNVTGLTESEDGQEYTRLMHLLPSLSVLNLEGHYMDHHPAESDGSHLIQFVKSCTHLEAISVNIWTSNVLSSLGGLKNLRMFSFSVDDSGAPAHVTDGFSETDFDSLMDNFPPNLERLFLNLPETYSTLNATKLVRKLENVTNFELEVLGGSNSCTGIESTPVESRKDGLTGLRRLTLQVKPDFVKLLLNAIKLCPLRNCTTILLRGLASNLDEPYEDQNDSRLYNDIPNLAICFPNVTALGFSDYPSKLNSHLPTMVKLREIRIDAASQTQFNIDPYMAELILSIESVTTYPSFLSILLKPNMCIRVSSLKILGRVDAALSKKIADANWPSLTELSIDLNLKKSKEPLPSHLVRLVAHMPVLKKLKLRDFRVILSTIDQIPVEIREMLDLRDLKKLVGSLGLLS